MASRRRYFCLRRFPYTGYRRYRLRYTKKILLKNTRYLKFDVDTEIGGNGNQSDMIVNIKAINVVDYFNNSYDKLYPTDTSKHFSAIISTCTQKLFDMDMEIAQLHGI